MRAATEWSLWSTTARLVVDHPAAAGSALTVFDRDVAGHARGGCLARLEAAA
ncbi:MAG TPA: hypothetical protein VN107_10680 [Microbacterium sp.]|nr:hypothetical protein [Microbacterium sp.]